MKRILVLCLLFAYSISYGQLYVENSAYVFVNDEIITITEDVNLRDANSKIYLRNEAQLIQLNNIGKYRNWRIKHTPKRYSRCLRI